ENLIAVDDVSAIDGDFGIYSGFGAGGDDDVLGFKFAEAVGVVDADVMRAGEASGAVNYGDVIAFELALNDSDFIFDHVLHAEIEVRHGADVFAVVIGAVKILIVKAGEMQDRLAHGLAGNC